jgi:hypothetical protein
MRFEVRLKQSGDINGLYVFESHEEAKKCISDFEKEDGESIGFYEVIET